MWTRAELKDKSKETLIRIYWKLVLVALIANVISGVSNSLELKYEEFNYQEEVNLRLATLQASLEDIKKEINRSTDDKIKIDLEYRYKKLVKIYNKYTESVKNIRDESSYEKIAYSLNNDLENTYEIINN